MKNLVGGADEMASKYKIVGGARGLPVKGVTAEDMARLRFRSDISLYTTPIGMRYEDYLEGKKVIYIKRAVPWKGLKGSAFWEEAKKHVGKKGVGLDEGLRRAIKISQDAAKTYGVVIHDGRILPAKAVKQMELAARS